jgi:hypothetical protein
MVRISTALLVLGAAALLVAGCGGSRHDAVPRSLAVRLAAESDAVAARVRAGDGCGAATLARRLQRDAASVPAVRRAATALVAEIACVAPAPAPPATTTAAAAAGHAVKRHPHERPHVRHPRHPHRKHHGHGKKGDG